MICVWSNELLDRSLPKGDSGREHQHNASGDSKKNKQVDLVDLDSPGGEGSSGAA